MGYHWDGSIADSFRILFWDIFGGQCTNGLLVGYLGSLYTFSLVANRIDLLLGRVRHGIYCVIFALVKAIE